MEGTKKVMYLGILVAAAIVLVFMGVVKIGAGLTADDTETVSVNITVQQVTAIDVSPNAVNWTSPALYPGYEGTQSSYSNSWIDVAIENVGSTNITKIWMSASQPTSDPYTSTGNPSAFDSASFIAVRKEGGSYFYIVQSKEFNETLPDYVILPTPTGVLNLTGKIRLGITEYYLAFDDTTNDGCHNGTVYISEYPKTNTTDGDYDLSNNTGITVNPNDNKTTYGVAAITLKSTGQGIDETYCLFTAGSCDYFIITKWNKDLDEGTADDCSADDYIFLGSTLNPLQPGNVTQIKLAPRIPFGVAAGNLAQGTLTIYASQT